MYFFFQAGTRPHVIFAKSEVRITVYDDGRRPAGDISTGFESDIEGKIVINIKVLVCYRGRPKL